MNNKTGKRIYLLFICYLVILILASDIFATQPPRPGERLDKHGPGIGLGTFFTWAGPHKEFGPGGGYWIEAGYGYVGRFFKFPSLNFGMHHMFYSDNKEDITMYLDFTFLFLSAGPLTRYRNRENHYGGFISINIPILSEPFTGEIRDLFGKGSGDTLIFPYFQLRAEFASGTGSSFFLGFMYKCDFLIFYREVPFKPVKQKPAHSEKDL